MRSVPSHYFWSDSSPPVWSNGQQWTILSLNFLLPFFFGRLLPPPPPSPSPIQHTLSSFCTIDLQLFRHEAGCLLVDLDNCIASVNVIHAFSTPCFSELQPPRVPAPIPSLMDLPIVATACFCSNCRQVGSALLSNNLQRDEICYFRWCFSASSNSWRHLCTWSSDNAQPTPCV